MIFSTNGAEKTRHPHARKNESGRKLYTLHKKLKVDYRPKYKIENYKTPKTT